MIRYIKYLFIAWLFFNLGLISAMGYIYGIQEDEITAVQIENRWINFPEQKCYTEGDINLILTGK